MNNKESIALYELGRDAWNKWAQEMLAKREKLEQAGDWNEVTKIDFNGHIFSHHVDFFNFIFPGITKFRNVIFQGHSRFEGAVFEGDTDFNGAKFEGNGWFKNAQFKGDAEFNDVIFERAAGFSSTIFKGDTKFTNAVFKKSAGFIGANFEGDTGFPNSSFNGGAFYREATFKKMSLFEAIQANSTFSLEQTNFTQLPDFRQAHFREAPDMDSMIIHEKPSKGDETVAIYRALKRLAILGHDHEQELNFFAGELEAKGSLLGKLYGLLSDYGRSLAIPVLSWWMTTLYAWIGYFSLTLFSPTNEANHPAKACSIIADAFELSLRKGLLALGWEKSSRLDQIYTCLYGVNKGSESPIIPFAASIGGLVQTVLSAVFIFLFLLALRNRFRIK